MALKQRAALAASLAASLAAVVAIQLPAFAAGGRDNRQNLGQPLPQRGAEQVYGEVCGYCHGRNVGPILLGRHLPAAVVQTFVRNGHGAMPAFRPTEITPAELNELAQWIERAPARSQEHGQ